MNYYKTKYEIQKIFRNILVRYCVVFLFGFITSSYIGITKKEMTDMITNVGYFIMILLFGILVIVAIIKMPPPSPRRDDVEIIRIRRD